MENASAPADSDTNAPILCRVTPWYYRRMAMLGGMLLVFGLYFIYDGRYGYPRENEIAAQKAWFESEILQSYDEAQKAGRIEMWEVEAQKKGWPTGVDSKAPRWASWAAERGYPEDPKHHTPEAIAQQLWLGGACLLVLLLVCAHVLITRRKTVRAGADHWITPDGRTIHFAHVFRLDLRKWRNKGLGYAWYRESAEGPERRAVLDYLKFSNMELVLQRLRAQFKGELIEKVEEPEVPDSEAEGNP